MDDRTDHPPLVLKPEDFLPKPKEKLGRRLFVFRAAAILSATTALLHVGGTTPAQAQCSDRDVGDPSRRGRRCRATGCTDSDPSDTVGSGRRCGGRARPRVQQRPRPKQAPQRGPVTTQSPPSPTPQSPTTPQGGSYPGAGGERR